MKLSKSQILYIVFGKSDKNYPYWLKSIFIILWFWTIVNIPLGILRIISLKMFFCPIIITFVFGFFMGLYLFLVDLLVEKDKIKKQLDEKINKIVNRK